MTQLPLNLSAPRTQRARALSGGSPEAYERLTSSGEAQRQRDEVLAALRLHPKATSAELARDSGLDYHMVARRLPDLLAAELVSRSKGFPKCSITDTVCYRWEAR